MTADNFETLRADNFNKLEDYIVTTNNSNKNNIAKLKQLLNSEINIERNETGEVLYEEKIQPWQTTWYHVFKLSDLDYSIHTEDRCWQLTIRNLDSKKVLPSVAEMFSAAYQNYNTKHMIGKMYLGNCSATATIATTDLDHMLDYPISFGPSTSQNRPILSIKYANSTLQAFGSSKLKTYSSSDTVVSYQTNDGIDLYPCYDLLSSTSDGTTHSYYSDLPCDVSSLLPNSPCYVPTLLNFSGFTESSIKNNIDYFYLVLSFEFKSTTNYFQGNSFYLDINKINEKIIAEYKRNYPEWVDKNNSDLMKTPTPILLKHVENFYYGSGNNKLMLEEISKIYNDNTIQNDIFKNRDEKTGKLSELVWETSNLPIPTLQSTSNISQLPEIEEITSPKKSDFQGLFSTASNYSSISSLNNTNFTNIINSSVNFKRDVEGSVVYQQISSHFQPLYITIPLKDFLDVSKIIGSDEDNQDGPSWLSVERRKSGLGTLYLNANSISNGHIYTPDTPLAVDKTYVTNNGFSSVLLSQYMDIDYFKLLDKQYFYLYVFPAYDKNYSFSRTHYYTESGEVNLDFSDFIYCYHILLLGLSLQKNSLDTKLYLSNRELYYLNTPTNPSFKLSDIFDVISSSSKILTTRNGDQGQCYQLRNLRYKDKFTLTEMAKIFSIVLSKNFYTPEQTRNITIGEYCPDGESWEATKVYASWIEQELRKFINYTYMVFWLIPSDTFNPGGQTMVCNIPQKIIESEGE